MSAPDAPDPIPLTETETMRDTFPRSIALPDHLSGEAHVVLRELAGALSYREAWAFATDGDHAEAALTAEKLERLGSHLADLCVARAEDLRRTVPDEVQEVHVDAASDAADKWFAGLRVEWVQ